MELTYTNHNRIEQGVIQDFNLDIAYGKDENDFEIKTSENVLHQGDYWYIPDSEYGGIVDEVEATTNEYEITYRGRSFQGILESYNMLEINAFDGLAIDNDSIIINGLPSQILSGIISQLDLPFTVEAQTEDVVTVTVDRNQGVYSFLRSAFEPSSYKIKIGSDFTISITGALDFTSEDYFDTTQYAVKVKTSSKKPNHLIGVYKRDGENTIVKHLYFDEDGIVQPYYQLDSMHGLEPLHDYEYERVADNKVITGIDEVVEVIEGGSTVETMDLVTELTDQDGNTPFVDGKPYDWDEKVYTDYYMIDGQNEETGELQYKNPEVENEYESFTIDDSPSATGEYSFLWWTRNWNKCYKKTQSNPDVYTQLSETDCTRSPDHSRIDQIPPDWNTKYAEYMYYVSGSDYQAYTGVEIPDYAPQYRAGDAWANLSTRGEFYIYVEKKKWKLDKKWSGLKTSEWVYDSLNSVKLTPKKTVADLFGNVTKTTGWKKAEKNSNTSYQVHKPVTYWRGKMTLTDYCAYAKKKLQDIPWVSGKYYLKYTKGYSAPTPKVLPNGDFNIYKEYTMIDQYPPVYSGGSKITYYFPKDIIKPPYVSGQYYRKVKNNYGELIKTMLSKYDEIIQGLTVIEPNIDLDIAEFDVGDIIGSVHPFTHEQLSAKIGKKIVTGNSTSLTVSYEIA